MGRVCQVSGKRTSFGNSISRRGLPKKKGGIGLKTTGITARKFKPNLQRVRVLLPDGTVKRMRVAASVIRNGWITVTEGGKEKRVPLVKAPRGRNRKEPVVQTPPTPPEPVSESASEPVSEQVPASEPIVEQPQEGTEGASEETEGN
jgi:large subunit ribosomal protein L28